MATLGGQYVGLGEGDTSPAIVDLKALMKRKYTPARNTLDDGPLFTPALTAEVKREQLVFLANGTLDKDKYLPGIVNLAFKYAVGLLSKEKILPLYFSTEGHMSDMWQGPVAWIGEVLRAEGRALHFPTWYDRFSLPFKNPTGVEALRQRFSATSFTLDDGTVIKFPPGTPIGVGAFSQGSMIWCDFYRQYLMPGKPLNWRLKDLRFAIVCGNPDREIGKCASWITDPPPLDHQGIMDDDDRMTDTPWWWLEIARKGDLYTDNASSGKAAADKTAMARLITEGEWAGGKAGLISRVVQLIKNPTSDTIPAAVALYDTIRFATNMSVHGMYDLDPAVQFARERLAA